MRSFIFKIFAALFVAQSAVAFVPQQASKPAFAPLTATNKPLLEKVSQFMTTAAVVISTSPLVALAEEADDYEYGAVNAPIGIAWAGGVLAILTALLPIALQGGEDAFNEMKDRDADKWGTGNSDALNRRR
mmetsp:Transcript_49114/g.141196  ORF Transcript_49114/g.141196 Transcript_49114/m.141196 type:complete len:131 (+) Transcript_49114:80-472(+)